MLQIVAGLALLVVVALAGYRRTFTRLPVGARLLFLTGTEYIFVGYALGENMIGLLDEPTIRSLTPLFSLGLGLIGLMLGLPLEVPLLRRFPASWFRMTVTQAVVTMVVVFGPAYIFLRAVSGVEGPELLLASLVLATTAACTAQSALAILSRELSLGATRTMQVLRYVSSLDGAVAVSVFGLAICLLHHAPLIGPGTLVTLQWFVLSVGIGVATGFLLHLLTRIRCREEELLLFVIGMVLFASGLALYLKLSPLFVNLVMGVVAANQPGPKTRILNLLARLEKPFYVVFLVLAGAIWQMDTAWALPLAALYFALRLAGKVGGGALAVSISGERPRPPRLLGLGLVSQGGVVIAMAMSYYQVSSFPLAEVVVTAVLLGVIFSELFGPALARLLLRNGPGGAS
ncbi:MAG: hypothetical protein ABFS86_18315 [Planctomycetota bacterium]